MKRDDFTMSLLDELIIDNFAGGGGTSEGLEQAFGRPVDIAINHNEKALAMHALNHPYTKHHCESVWDVDPVKVTAGRPVGLVWLSPDCKHFSKAKGGTPVNKEIRGLAWVGLRWAALVNPRVIMLENVEEFQSWGPLVIGPDGKAHPDPKRKGQTFKSFVRQLQQKGYAVEYKEIRVCDNGVPTIRKRLFLVARRDGLPIVFPAPSHGAPTSREVLAGILAPHRTAAECIDWSIEARSIFERKKPLVANTLRRVAKGMWRHVLTNATPFIVGAGGPVYSGKPVAIDRPIGTMTTENHRALAQPILTPFINEHANASSQRTMPADEPTRTLCAQVKGGHFSVVAPMLAPLRGTTEAHLGGHAVQQPLSTVSAGGTHHAMVGAHLVTVGYGEREGQQPRAHDIEAPLGTVVAGGVKQALVATHITKFRTGSAGNGMDEPMPTVTANSFIKRPGGSAPLGVVAAHLMHMTHHGDRAGTTPFDPLPTVTCAHRGEQAVAAAFFEQANGGFYDGDGRRADEPMSTITASGSNQRLIAAYCVKYYGTAQTGQAVDEPTHTVTTKDRMGLVEVLHVSADCLTPEQRKRAAQCAALLHEHLPEHFPEMAELVLMFHDGAWWALVDITLRMLVARELFNAQSFPKSYIIHEIPDPKLLFKDGVQIPGDPRLLPRIPLPVTDQVHMCGNSVPPEMAKALAIANFGHERLLARAA